MREEEAKQKWCPMTRTASSASNGVAAINVRDMQNISNETRCIASECMMWKWEKSSLNIPTTGYCGLCH